MNLFLRSRSPLVVSSILSVVPCSFAFLQLPLTTMSQSQSYSSTKNQHHQPDITVMAASSSATGTSTSSSTASSSSQRLFDPSARDAYYASDVAKYLVDLHDNKATFDFCGGMLFQLVLSEKLRSHLVEVSKNNNGNNQPIIYDQSKMRMHQLDNYQQSEYADNVSYFHGREVRQVKDAAGGMGFVLQLSHSSENDPEGWTEQERNNYDGWGHDAGRTWRNGDRLVKEGCTNFQNQFGTNAFALHHRFYLHKDAFNRMWLSAEDGCEGTPADAKGKGGGGGPASILSNLFRMGQ